MSKILIDLSILKDVIDDLIYARATTTDRDDYKRYSDQVEQLESVIEKSSRDNKTFERNHRCRDVEYFNWYNESING